MLVARVNSSLISPKSGTCVLKTILMAVVFFGLGYTMAVFMPMPGDWQDEVKAPFKSDGLIGGSIIGEYIGTVDDPAAVKDTVKEEDTTHYATQKDLLVSPFDAQVTYSILVGEYPSEIKGNEHLEYIGINNEAPVYIPFIDPLGQKTLLLLLGEYKDEAAARKQEKSWESQFDVNLKVVKKPVLPDPEAEQKQEKMEEAAEAISKILAGDQ